MATFLISFFTVVLLLLCIVLVLLVLMQKSNANSSMGSALGGGAAEQALGADANNVLTKLTIRGTTVFFVLAFGLYMGTQYVNSNKALGSDPNSLIEGLEESTNKEAAVENEYPELNAASAETSEEVAKQLEASIQKAVDNAVEEAEQMEQGVDTVKSQAESLAQEAESLMDEAKETLDEVGQDMMQDTQKTNEAVTK